MEDIKTKVCVKCEKEKPLTAFHKVKRNGEKVRSTCRECRSYMPEKKKKAEEDKMNFFKNGLIKCHVCGEILTLDNFYKSKGTNTGYHYQCKKCTLLKTREYKLRNPGKKKETDRLYAKKNRDHINKKWKEWSRTESGLMSIKKHNKKYGQSEKGKATQKRSRDKNKDKRKELNRKYKGRAKELRAKRKQEDVGFRIKCNLRTRMNQSIRLNNAVKQCKFDEYLGCTLEFFRKYLESKFTEGMTWNNYGRWGWHIDHIIPCDSFDFRLKENQLKCFHYTNLQSLWRDDNLRKGNKIQNAA